MVNVASARLAPRLPANLRGLRVNVAGPLALTLGDPAGIGPEIVVKALTHDAVLRDQVVVVGDALVLQDALSRYAPEFRIKPVNLRDELPEFHEHDIALHATNSLLAPPPMGRVSAEAGRAAYDAIIEAAQLCLEGHTCGLSTAPINKLALRAAGINEPGHTEILARMAGLEGTHRFAMMFASEHLQVVLATIHLPLSQAINALTPELIFEKIQLTHEAGRWLGKINPKIAIAGINPHAGEGGMLGSDEARVLVPAIKKARAHGFNVTDPLPPDTVFMRARTGEFDVVLALYDERIWDPHSDEYLDLCNDASLLLRLELAGVNVGARWQPLLDKVRNRHDEHIFAFVDAHFMLALAACRAPEAQLMLDSLRALAANGRTTTAEVTRYVGLALCEAIAAHRAGDHARAVARLGPLRQRLQAIGGSHTQRDVFEQLLADAAAR